MEHCGYRNISDKLPVLATNCKGSMAGSSGNYALHKANNDVNTTNRYRTCQLTAKQNLNVSENNLETGLTHISNCKGNKSEDENRKSEVGDKETKENSTTDSTLRPNHKYMSKSGDPKMSRGILKNVHNNTVNRPTTIGSRREIDTIVVPRWSSMENQKYRLKINGFVNLDDPDTGKGSRENRLPEVNVDMVEGNVYNDLKGTKPALREKAFEAGDTYTYFNTVKMHQKSETESPLSFDVGHVGLSPPRSRSRSLDSVEDGVYRDPWEDTPERKCISISDSEECDTDLEIDKDFGKGSPRKNVPPYLPDIIPLSDMNVGKTLYTRECQKWQIAPQKHVLHSLQERSMTLRNRSLGARAIPPLSAALKDNLRVERLNLDGVDITDDGIQHLAEMLIDNITITHLNVANNNLGIRGAQVLGHVLVVTQNITNLNLSGNKLDENSSWYLTSGIGSNTSITHLDLSYNELGEQAGVLMGSALAHNNTLCNLNICWNKVCGKGAVAIFRALMLNSTLEVLNISWNGLGYDGTVALSKCLKRNGGLRDLDVSNNRLNWRCAFLLAEGLRGNTTLAKLRIGHNPLTTTGVMDMLEAVATAESAITLLDCTEIPVLGAADLLSATISRRRTFNFMHGGIVPTHDKFGERLGRELNPMLRIIEYLRLLGLRPLELMKSFDKTSNSFELPRKDFIDQIKKIGVKLHSYEIDALANSISGKGYNKNVINYRKLSLAVREVVEAERERKIKEREEWLQIKTYHESILKKGTLDEYISHSGSVRDPLDPLKVKSFQTIGRSGTSRNSTVSKPGSVDSSKFKVSLFSPIVISRSSFRPVKQKSKKKETKKRHI